MCDIQSDTKKIFVLLAWQPISSEIFNWDNVVLETVMAYLNITKFPVLRLEMSVLCASQLCVRMKSTCFSLLLPHSPDFHEKETQKHISGTVTCSLDN